VTVRQGLAAGCAAWVASTNASVVRPALELLGDLLMEVHEPKEALMAYRQVLSVALGRRNAAKGIAEAERATANKVSRVR